MRRRYCYSSEESSIFLNFFLFSFVLSYCQLIVGQWMRIIGVLGLSVYFQLFLFVSLNFVYFDTETSLCVKYTLYLVIVWYILSITPIALLSPLVSILIFQFKKLFSPATPHPLLCFSYYKVKPRHEVTLWGNQQSGITYTFRLLLIKMFY